LHNRGQVPLEDLEVAEIDPLDRSQGTSSWKAFQNSRHAGLQPLMIEQGFQMASHSLDVRGRVDAIYGDRDWEIVDFKTGSAPKDPAVKQAALVQLQAYAVAAADGHLGRPLEGEASVTFSYLGSPPSEVRYAANAGWMEEARERLHSLSAGITKGERQPTPSTACQSCDFLHFCAAGQAFVNATEGT
jgi:RecB family exonuclease